MWKMCYFFQCGILNNGWFNDNVGSKRVFFSIVESLKNITSAT